MYFSANDPRAAFPERQSESSLLDVIDVLVDSKWLVAAITCLGLAVALVYVAAVPPKYEASTLIQVEAGKPVGASTGSAYADAANLFESRSPAIAEISILRSGAVLTEVVDRLGLAVSARPKYVPVIGEWLARRATAPSRPGLPGLPGYVYGNESIQVGSFVVPRENEGQPFSVVLTEKGYDLLDPKGRHVVTGAIGKLESFDAGTSRGQILVAAAVGAPGAEFRIERLARSAVIENLQRRLKIDEQGKQSGMLRMRLAGSDPEMVSNTLNEIGRSYIRQNVERKTAEAEKALVFVESILPTLRTQITQAEAKLSKFRNQNGNAEVTAKGKLALEQSVRLETSLHELQNKRRELDSSLLGDHPRMRALDAQIAGATAELARVDKSIKVLPPQEQQTLGLTRELKVKSDLFANLLNSAQQFQLAKDERVGNVRIVDPAWPAQEPSGPQPPALLAAGATGGLVLGMLLALLRNSLRRGVQDPEWIDGRTAMSVLTTVPYSKTQRLLTNASPRRRQGDTRVLAIRSPQDPAVESLRSMRTALQRKMPGARSHIVVITGPTHGIGKSFTSMNLAAVLGATGQKVLLIDADMRKGRLNDSFAVPPGPGLSDILMGKGGLGHVVHRNVIPNVDFIAMGSPSPSPADLLTSRIAELLLREASGAYDYVVVDTPPVLAAADAAIIAQWAGAVFMIARAGVTSLRELDESEKRLSQRGIEVDGVVYTGVDVSKRRNDIYTYGGYDYRMTR